VLTSILGKVPIKIIAIFYTSAIFREIMCLWQLTPTRRNKMTRFTEKTIRTEKMWVKITRDNEKRTFTFARGYTHNIQAHDIQMLNFKWISNWAEAIDKSKRMIQSYTY
jgi:hypothetical protein